MGRGKRNRAGHRGGDVRDWHGARGSEDNERNADEDDPLRDLRPQDQEPEPGDPDGDEFIWPEVHDENEDDD